MRQSNTWPPAIPESGMEFYAYLGVGPNCDCSRGARHRNGERQRAFFFVLFLRHMIP
jgi:hypothetical protein